MAILVGSDSRVLVQGITGNTGRGIAERMVGRGTRLVAGVTPGKGGVVVHGVPVFDSCHEAVATTGGDASLVVVPPPFVKDACLDAIVAGVKTIVVYTEGVPRYDAVTVAAYARVRGTILLGPNSAGCVTPGQANLSDLNDDYLNRGRVGIVSKSGTLAAEVVFGLGALGLGQSTVVCLGGDPIIGTDHAEILRMFDADVETDAVVLIGEIGGRSELLAAEVVAGMTKPVVAYVAGRNALPTKAMGHAGAIVGSGGLDSAPVKIAALREAGATIADVVTDVAPLVGMVLRADLSRHA